MRSTSATRRGGMGPTPWYVWMLMVLLLFAAPFMICGFGVEQLVYATVIVGAFVFVTIIQCRRGRMSITVGRQKAPEARIDDRQ